MHERAFVANQRVIGLGGPDVAGGVVEDFFLTVVVRHVGLGREGDAPAVDAIDRFVTLDRVSEVIDGLEQFERLLA